MTAAAWHPDPTGRHELRYWDGNQWTEHVSDAGVQSVSPLQPPADTAGSGAADEAASVVAACVLAASCHAGCASEIVKGHWPTEAGEAAGGDAMQETPDPSLTEESMGEQPAAEQQAAQAPSYEQAQPPAYQPQHAPQAQPPAYQPAQAYPQQGGGAYGDAFAGITGELIDGRFSEVGDTPGPSKQNSKLLKVRVAEPFMAKQGSMVAYQGNVNFAYQGGGAAKFLKKALTGEGLNLMRVEGQGDVFLGDAAHEVHILHLNNSGLSINGNNVLAFSAALDWNIERVKGGSIAAGGLFNTTLRGTGWVAVTTDGNPVVLNAQEAPTYADANALVAWSVQLQTSIRSTFTAGSLIGRGSGEAFQVAFNGPGFVIVQPSEGAQVPPHTH